MQDTEKSTCAAYVYIIVLFAFVKSAERERGSAEENLARFSAKIEYFVLFAEKHSFLVWSIHLCITSKRIMIMNLLAIKPRTAREGLEPIPVLYPLFCVNARSHENNDPSFVYALYYHRIWKAKHRDRKLKKIKSHKCTALRWFFYFRITWSNYYNLILGRVL
jgi:hypothetical protein